MNSKLLATTCLVSLTLQACAETTETQSATEEDTIQSSQDIGEAAFVSSDRNQDGVIDREELEAMASSMFVSMDFDDDGTVTPDEFNAWDFGLVTTSKREGTQVGFETAKRILFALHDLDSSQGLDQDEHVSSLKLGFERADQDASGSMEKDEYAQRFLPNIIFRAAIEPVR
ncbi:MAG: hypothetical protein AAGL10_15970 [Pseudomonadota bacterium]